MIYLVGISVEVDKVSENLGPAAAAADAAQLVDDYWQMNLRGPQKK